MLLSIIILNYNKKELTLKCIASIHEKFREELNRNQIEVLVIDNKSKDDSVVSIKEVIKKYKNFIIIPNKENAGFGGGCNFGASYAHGNYLLFLNNDTTVEDNGIIKMASFLTKHPEIAILGGALSKSDGQPQPSCGKFYTPLFVFLLLLGFQKFGLIDKNPSKIQEVDWVKGALFMIRREAFQKLGGFDRNIFMYTEDMELCYRAKKAGYLTYFYPDVNIIHVDHGSSTRAFAIINIYKNIVYFYKKHRKNYEYLLVKFLLKSKAIILICFGKLLRSKYLMTTYEEALKNIR